MEDPAEEEDVGAADGLGRQEIVGLEGDAWVQGRGDVGGAVGGDGGEVLDDEG